VNPPVRRPDAKCHVRRSSRQARRGPDVAIIEICREPARPTLRSSLRESRVFTQGCLPLLSGWFVASGEDVRCEQVTYLSDTPTRRRSHLPAAWREISPARSDSPLRGNDPPAMVDLQSALGVGAVGVEVENYFEQESTNAETPVCSNLA